MATRCCPASPSASASSSGFTARPPMRASAARASSASLPVPWRTALHEREGEVAVDLDEEPPVDLALRVADRERQSSSCSSDSSVPLPRLICIERRAARETSSSSGAPRITRRNRRSASSPWPFERRRSASSRYVMKRRSFFAIAARNSTIACSDVLPLPVHLAEAAVALGVVGVQLDGARGVLDRVVVAIELQGVLRHALIELARALRLDGDELLEHGDGVAGSCSPGRAHARARGSCRRRPGRASTTLRSVASACGRACGDGAAPRRACARPRRRAAWPRTSALSVGICASRMRSKPHSVTMRERASRARILSPLAFAFSASSCQMHARLAVALRALERARELLLVGEVLRLELHGLLERRERVGGHVVLEVDLTERGERACARRHRGEDAPPCLDRRAPGCPSWK